MPATLDSHALRSELGELARSLMLDIQLGERAAD
jgi:glycine cleavage system regulatory protein